MNDKKFWHFFDNKTEFNELFKEQVRREWINLTTAINVFLRKSLTAGGFPFDVRIDEPNKETMLALLEADKLSKDPNVKGLDVENALRELKK